MKRLLVPTAALLVMAACNSRPENSFVINGTIEDADGDDIEFVYFWGDSAIRQTATVTDGKFRFSGEVAPFGCRGYVKYGEETKEYSGDNTKDFYFGADDMMLTLEKGKIKDGTLTGSSLQKIADEEMRLNKESYNKRSALRDSIKSFPEKREIYESRNENLLQEIRNAQHNFIAANSDNYVGYELFRNTCDYFPISVAQELYDGLTPELKAADKIIAPSIKARRLLEPGMTAPELKGFDPLRDREVSLSELKGKYVLIDFWATWCHGCVMGLPHVKELYDKYHDKGLEVIALSKDYNINVWKEYIGSHDMAPYYNILTYSDMSVNDEGRITNDDRENMQDRFYNIKFIPQTFIVDPEGNLVAHPEDEEKTDALLKEIFGF